MIIAITGYSQVNVHNVVPSFAIPYFQANIRVDDTLQTNTLLAIDGAVLFSGTTGTTPASGAGTRLMWVPSKKAFRAGEPGGTSWNDANIGTNSVGFGYYTTASAYGTMVWGEGSMATGMLSTAWGSAKAKNDYATAWGNSNEATGIQSTAWGSSNIANGNMSTSFGFNTKSNSMCLLAFGLYNDTTLSASKTNWVATDPIFQIGNGGYGALNDAFRVLKNGKTFIGDASSTTDAILVVDPTDSTSTFIGNVIQNGVVNNTDTVILSDDSTLVFANGLKGGGSVWIFNASDSLVAMGTYGLSADGTVYLAMNSGAITIVGTTDNKFNIFDNGTGHTYENKLGYSVTVMYEVKTW